MGRASREGPLHEIHALAFERVERNIPSEIHTANTGFVADKYLSTYRSGLLNE